MTADIVFRGGLVVDGTGAPGVLGDVVVEGDRVVAVTKPGAATGRRIVDADGLVIAPGFIDMHSHSDVAVISDVSHEAKILQGVTLEVLGQDGFGFAPVSTETRRYLRPQLASWYGEPEDFVWDWETVGGYLKRVDAVTPVNVAYLVPHGNVRLLVMGDADREPTPTELTAMKGMVEDGLKEGAVGLSTGLTYVPASFAQTPELIELCRSVAEFGGYFSPHTRNYGATVFVAYSEGIDIAEASGVELHLTHAHVNFPLNSGRAHELLDMIDLATARGVDISLDTYPYTAGATSLHAIMPFWVLQGGIDAVLARLTDPDTRQRILQALEVDGSDGHHDMTVEWHTIILSGATSRQFHRFAGSNISEIADALGESPGETYLNIVVAEELSALCIVDVGNEENVREIMQHSAHTASSDGLLVGQQPHPRGWGAFPRYLAKYVRELEILSLEECVRHLTSNAARRLGFSGRGVIEPGAFADLVCFSANEIEDRATMVNPKATPAGIPYVVINGEIAVDNGIRTSTASGRVLRRPNH